MFLWQPLVALTRLGAGGWDSGLKLESTDAYGDAMVLRAIPGLGSGWPSDSYHASLCSAFSGGCPAGSSPVADAATFVASDACACCTTVAGLTRDAAGVCVDATQG